MFKYNIQKYISVLLLSFYLCHSGGSLHIISGLNLSGSKCSCPILDQNSGTCCCSSKGASCCSTETSCCDESELAENGYKYSAPPCSSPEESSHPLQIKLHLQNKVAGIQQTIEGLQQHYIITEKKLIGIYHLIEPPIPLV